MNRMLDAGLAMDARLDAGLWMLDIRHNRTLDAGHDAEQDADQETGHKILTTGRSWKLNAKRNA